MWPDRVSNPGPLCPESGAQTEGERIMLETRFTAFPTLSVDPGAGISQSVSETHD